MAGTHSLRGLDGSGASPKHRMTIDRTTVVSARPRDAFLMVGDKKVFSLPPAVTDLTCGNSGVLGVRSVPIAEADEQFPARYGSVDESV